MIPWSELDAAGQRTAQAIVDDLEREPTPIEREQETRARRLAEGQAQHLSRAQVTAVLRAHRAGYAYVGQHSPGSARVTERTLIALAEPGCGVLDRQRRLTIHGQQVATILVAEARRYV